MRILSGIKPSGALHIGNYFGMIKPMVASQTRGELFCFIANMHGLTSLFDAAKMRQFTDDAILDLLALGIDPEQSVLWVQSDVPEVAELTWYLSNVTAMGLLERCHAYKDALAKGIPPNTGIFTYPVLMAADILVYQSAIVPVGKDQKQHIEVTRDIATRFNATYGEAFTIPDAEIREELALIPGVDGQKMSKSYGNTIELFGDEKTVKKSVMGIVTDATPVEAPKDPDQSTIFALYRLFAADEAKASMAQRFRAGGLGYGTAKKELFDLIWNHFAASRTRRTDLEKNRDYCNEIRKKGADKARVIASKTMTRVRELVGMC